LRFLCKAIDQHGAPAKITIDKSGANAAAIESYKDDRAIKRQVRPMIGFKSFWSAAVTFAGIELTHMIRKGQLKAPATTVSGAAVLFVGQLTFMARRRLLRLSPGFATEPAIVTKIGSKL
jgi:hypothetical protein